MKRFLVGSLLLIAAGSAFWLHAQTADLRAKFEGFDANQDGEIAGDEMQASPILPRLDLDGNGRLTLAEAVRAVAQMRRREDAPGENSAQPGDRRLFDFLDKNQDGRLDVAELPRRSWLERLDLNKDSFVSFEEADTVVTRMKQAGESLPSIPGVPAETAIGAEEGLKEQPRVLKAADHGVGRLVADLRMLDLSGKERKLSEHLKGHDGIILAFFGASCPISGKFGPELARLEKEATAQNLEMLLICPVAAETKEDIGKFTSAQGLESPVVHDTSAAVTNALSAKTTCEVFLIDSARTLIYRGAINDQYGLGYAKEQPSQTYLRNAIASLKARQRPVIAATTAPGCALDMKPEASVAATELQVTYHRQIERILQTSCVECHRAGGVGPFSLETYEDVIENAGMIRKQVERGAMPPWFAAAPPDGHDSPWINDGSLSKQAKTELLAWLNSPDRPRGDPAEAPAKLHRPEEWALGEPDAVFQLPRPVSIKAEGTMPYQFLTVSTDFAEDRWVTGYEIRPTDASVVHHVIVQVHARGAKVRDRGEGAEGYWAAYVPGNTHHQWPEGFAKKLPAGATLSFQIHYTPNGRATQDQMRIGLHFAQAEPRYIVHTASVAHTRIRIPAGVADHVETKDQRVPFDMHVLAYMAHMHVRGKAFKYELLQPDGSRETLLDIPRYDFNWQLRYDYAQPRLLRQGSKVRITAVYDNSADNPANPDPSKEVRWGPQTQDEMMIGYIEYFTPHTPGVAAN